MKTNLALAFFSSLFSLAGLYFVVDFFDLRKGQPAGSNFATVAELREKIGQRDKRDLRSDKSVSLRSLMEPNPSDMIIYELAKNLQVKFQKQPVRTNSFGMRGPEISLEKGEGTYRIALLGDSFAFGWGVKEDESFARVLEEKLQRLATEADFNKKIEVLNFGVPGYSTFQQVGQFKEKGLNFRPDLVLVYFIENDFGLPFFIKQFESGEGLATALDFEKFRRNKNKKVSGPARTWLARTNPNHALVSLAKLGEKEDFPVFVAINPRKKWSFDLQRLWALPQEKNLHLLDLRTPLLAFLEETPTINRKKDLSLAHDPHPSPLMHLILGSLLAEGLKTKVLTR